MDMNQRPHSRKKTVGSGSTGVGKGDSVGGGAPFGSGGRKEGSHGGGSSSRAGGMKLSPKTLLILAVIAIGVLVLSKGGGGLLSGLSGLNFEDATANINNGGYSYTDDSYSSYSKPDYTVSKSARAKRVTPLGNGKDEVTVMVYMCGTDLESRYGMATKDIQEMLKAKISDKVNLIIETGGCKKWQNNVVSNTKNQIYKVENGSLRKLEDNMGNSAMTDPKNLASFIDYCEKNYPADRNMLIFWDHGGGSLTGYGYDEKNASASSMTLSKINSALKSADCTFDFIGFDACLMATLENALVCNGYADYLIASEESEPGTGWYYTNWLTELSNNTSTSTVDLAQTIIDDFVKSCQSSAPSAKVTLSLTDLAELQGTIPSTFKDFSSSTNEMITSDDYKVISDARAGARQFAQESRINQVDLADLATRIDTKESKALVDAIHGCVKYNKSTISRCSGLSIYFPYESTSSVKSAVASYKDLGIDDEYAQCIKSFASLELGGQIAGSASQLPDISSSMGDLLGTLLSSYTSGGTTAASTSSSSPIGALLGSFLGGGTTTSAPAAGNGLDLGTLTSLLSAFSGRSMPAEYDWVDTELIADKAKDIAEDYLDPSHLFATEKDGKKVLSLSNEEWNLIQTVELNVFVNDGEGFIDLGLDNTFDWYDNDLLLDFDGTWLTLNGHTCAYYLVSDSKMADGTWTTVGRIPAILNGQLVNLQVVFDEGENEQGTITGAYPIYGNGETDVMAKGAIEVKAGDKIQLLCDYYDLDGNYSDSFTLGQAFTVPQSGLTLQNLELDVDTDDISYAYRITDIYGNHYWVPVD